MNRSVLGLTTALLMSALIIGGCGRIKMIMIRASRYGRSRLAKRLAQRVLGIREPSRIGRKRIWHSRWAAA